MTKYNSDEGLPVVGKKAGKALLHTPVVGVTTETTFCTALNVFQLIEKII
jgi:hypothetical protein